MTINDLTATQISAKPSADDARTRRQGS